MNANVTVLSTRGISRAGGVHGDGVERTEVATHTTDFVFKDLVVEASFEFTLAGRGGCDFHGGLATAEDHVVLFRGDGGCVEGGVGSEGFEDGKVTGGDDLPRLLVVVIGW